MNDSLSRKDFKELKAFIESRLGIKMPETKKGMIESRLRKRLTIHDISSYSDYCDYLFSPQGMSEELPHFIDAVTTNKTDFFREPNHFRYIVNTAVPELINMRRPGSSKTIKAWSCACSRGDEPYTLAMVLEEFRTKRPEFDYTILATDISPRVLDIAVKAIYDDSQIDPVPMPLRKKYLLKSRDPNRKLVRIVPQLRNKIRFRQLNLMDSDFKIRQQMDIIFCRNVIIYFNRETTARLIQRLCDKLVVGGYLLMGHSELLDCGNLPLTSVAPTVYRKVR